MFVYSQPSQSGQHLIVTLYKVHLEYKGFSNSFNIVILYSCDVVELIHKSWGSSFYLGLEASSGTMTYNPKLHQ